MFSIRLFIDDRQIATDEACTNLRAALRTAWEIIGGIPSAWAGIRYHGDHIAELETDWRGELSEAKVHALYRRCRARPYPVAVVTELNPRGPIFAGVFAR